MGDQAAMMLQLQQLTARNQDLERRVRRHEAAAAEAQLAQVPKPRAPALPERFDGTPALLRPFLAQLSLMFRLYPHSYPSEALQVGLIGSLLTGTAADWLTTVTSDPLPAIFNNVRGFTDKLAEVFGEHDAQLTADSKIRQLRQTTLNVQEYNIAFRKLAILIGWNDTALISQYRWGLRDDIKNLLISIQYVNSLEGIMSSAIVCSNRLIEQAVNFRPGGGQGGMARGGGNRFGPPAVAGGGPRRDFAPDDRARRFGEGPRCHRCNRQGHVAANCRGGAPMPIGGAPIGAAPIGGGRPIIPAYAGPRRAAIAVVEAEEENFRAPYPQE
jgi:Retrotransposon gag protein